MERVSGVSNWKLRVRREAEGITILQAATCDTAASLPDTLFCYFGKDYCLATSSRKDQQGF